MGRKAAGSLAKAPRTAEEAAGKADGGHLLHQSMSSARTRVRPDPGWTGPRRQRRPLNSYQPHPPWPAQRTRDRPRSLSKEIKRGRRLRQQFPRPTLTYPTSEQARLKKKKSPHRTVQRLRSQNSARSSTRHHRLLLRLRLLPRPTRSGRWRRRGGSNGGGSRGLGGGPAPCALIEAKEEGTETPPHDSTDQ